MCGSPPSLCFLCGHLGSLQRTSPVSYLSVALNCFSCYPVLKHHNMSDFHLSENKVGLCFFYSRSVAVGSSGSLIPAACCSSWYLHTCRAVWYGKAQEEHLELFPALRSCCMELSARKNLRLYGYFTDLPSCAIYDSLVGSGRALVSQPEALIRCRELCPQSPPEQLTLSLSTN